MFQCTIPYTASEPILHHFSLSKFSPKDTVPRPVEPRPQLSYPRLCDAARSRARIRHINPRNSHASSHKRSGDLEQQTYWPCTFPPTSPCPLVLLPAIEWTTSRRRPCAIVYQKQSEWCTPYCTHAKRVTLLCHFLQLAATSLRRDVSFSL